MAGQDGDGWLPDAMQLILASLDLPATAPLVLTVVAFDEGGGGQLIQLTVSSRAPGRLYRRVLNPEELRDKPNS